VSFIKTMSLASVQTAIRLGLSLISVKLTASTFGPEGLGLISQVGTFITLLGGLIAGGCSTAIVQLYHDAKRSAQSFYNLTNNSLWIWLCSIVIACLGAYFSPWLSKQLLGSSDNQTAMLCAFASVPMVVLAAMLQGWLTARESITTLYVGQIVSNVAGFFLMLFAIFTGNLSSALVATALAYSLPALWFGWVLLRESKFSLPTIGTPKKMGEIVKFYPMLLFHSAAMPATLIGVRWLLTNEQGQASMGAWQAGWRLSEIYVGLITTASATYFAPKLSKNLHDRKQFWRIVVQLICSVCVPIICIALALLTLRAWIVPLIFSHAFVQTIEFLPIQLLGDLPRALHWCVGLVLVSLVAQKWYITLEIVSVLGVGLFIFYFQGKVSNVVGLGFLSAFGLSASMGIGLLIAMFNRDRIR
jgi:O-antigen/teichoic acid export membrane protein